MRRLGQFLLFSTCNTYFYIDHLKVHHKWVGTEMDPATARYNENLYSFFIRSTIGQIKSSFKVEANRLKADGKSAWSFSNYVIGSIALQVVVWCLLVVLFGPMVLFIYLIQGFFANFLLEYTNYIEHYGLTRREKERVTEVHSWQTDRLISRFFLIDLSRHADHHYYASKPYHTLQSYENSPVLPGGYVSMIYYAMFPPLFFKKVNPLINLQK
ncbi:MAG: alkane 1-monooxygenase [Bacteroidetes bacterium]|nr:alkane 1-monooxygenase [Bacteroidota bacterium]